jgi:hypothetical protein
MGPQGQVLPRTMDGALGFGHEYFADCFKDRLSKRRSFGKDGLRIGGAPL